MSEEQWEQEREQSSLWEQQGEQFAEFVSSWVSGGGHSSDADEAWHSGVAYDAGWKCAPQAAAPERSNRPEYGTPEWDALARLEDERDMYDEMAGF